MQLQNHTALFIVMHHQQKQSLIEYNQQLRLRFVLSPNVHFIFGIALITFLLDVVGVTFNPHYHTLLMFAIVFTNFPCFNIGIHAFSQPHCLAHMFSSGPDKLKVAREWAQQIYIFFCLAFHFIKNLTRKLVIFAQFCFVSLMSFSICEHTLFAPKGDRSCTSILVHSNSSLTFAISFIQASTTFNNAFLN